MAELPNRIREYRKAKGWTLEELGEKVGCSYVHVSDIERGAVELSRHWMLRFSGALGVKPADLLLPEENSDSLSPDERELVERYRLATDDQREQLSRMAEVIVPWKGPTKSSEAA